MPWYGLAMSKYMRSPALRRHFWKIEVTEKGRAVVAGMPEVPGAWPGLMYDPQKVRRDYVLTDKGRRALAMDWLFGT